MDMNKNDRSVVYAGGLQFCFPGLGRFYLRDWGVGIFQIVTSLMLIGIMWSWIDGYLIITRQYRVKRDKVNLVYHNMLPGEITSLNLPVAQDQLYQKRSPVVAAILQLFCFGLGRIYLGYWLIGIFQIIVVINLYSITCSGFYSLLPNQVHQCYNFYSGLDCCKTFFNSLFPNSLLSFVTVYILGTIIRCIIAGLMIFDSYCIIKGYQVNADKKPLNYSIGMSFGKIKLGSKDRLIGGLLQLCLPGLGRCYMGYWIPGIIQFLASFIWLGAAWSWVDGHHILLNPDIDKDVNGDSLTDQNRLINGI